MENPIKMDDIEVPLFLETPIIFGNTHIWGPHVAYFCESIYASNICMVICNKCSDCDWLFWHRVFCKYVDFDSMEMYMSINCLWCAFSKFWVCDEAFESYES